MEYELKHGSNNDVLTQQVLKNGGTLPDFIKNRPYVLDESLQFYLQAFFMLESERQIGFGIYPIPLTKIIEFGKFLGYTDYADMYNFIHIIRELDSFTINYYSKSNKS